jgi:hypothetical protein
VSGRFDTTKLELQAVVIRNSATGGICYEH